MTKETNTLKKGNMKLLKFFLAALAGFGLVKLFGYITEAELNDEEEYDIYDEEDHPLFV
ncbi:MAG TPA: hypothetical protein VEA37_03510 [Flavobacterium sp.]|nr:hypothetical protein [Flavobacterium sp.]